MLVIYHVIIPHICCLQILKCQNELAILMHHKRFIGLQPSLTNQGCSLYCRRIGSEAWWLQSKVKEVVNLWLKSPYYNTVSEFVSRNGELVSKISEVGFKKRKTYYNTLLRPFFPSFVNDYYSPFPRAKGDTLFVLSNQFKNPQKVKPDVKPFCFINDWTYQSIVS